MIGQYRTIVYYGNEASTVRLESQGFDTYDEAALLLDRLLNTPQAGGRKFTGGDIEQHIGGGFGWVIADDVESIQIIARRQERD